MAKGKKKRRNYRKKKKTSLFSHYNKEIRIGAAIVASLLIIFLIIKSRQPRYIFKHYPDFGISIPAEYIIHGIDVSRHQGVINWEMVKEVNIDSVRIGFVFMKATEGIESKDPNFQQNWKEARRVKIPRGAYHFFLPNKDGTLQAKNFIKQVTLLPGDLPPVVDVEQLYGTLPQLMRKELKEFIDEVENYYGVKPIIYTYSSFYKNFLKDAFPDYPLWIAHYLLENKRPQIEREWQFWQHSETGRVSGINVKTDFNVFYGDSLLFNDLLVK